MSGRWRLERGAFEASGGATTFSVWAPYADRLEVCVAAGGPERTFPMRLDAEGVHAVTVSDIEPGADYHYRFPDGRQRPDPVSRHQPAGVHGPARVVDADGYRWQDREWRGLDMSDLVLYELHVGTFTEGGTFHSVIDRLPYLKELGVTALELMPIAEFPGNRNWGYDGVHLYAPHHCYGGPQGLKELVDAAHQSGIGVVLDVVYNHLGPEGNYLGEFGPYFTDRYRTPWGRAMNFDGADSDAVRRYVIDNALHWITEFHVDGLRLDAVHAIYDFSARHILEELATRVHDQASRLGRTAIVIAESDLNDPRVLQPPQHGGHGLDAQWNDDFHHAIHAALTGERSGYYCDYGEVAHVAKALEDRFVLDGGYSRHRRRRHGAAARDVPADRFVAFIQNHDQVGNRAAGDRLSTLVSFEARKLAAAALLLSPFVPMLFMGEEHGEGNPFLYFVSHGDPELVEAVRQGRQREFASFGWQGTLPDPQDEETFRRSRVDWEYDANPRRLALRRLYRALLRIRTEEPGLRPGSARATVADGKEHGWIVVRYEVAEGAELAAVLNFDPHPNTVQVAWPPGMWALRISTEDESFGGDGGFRERLDVGADPTSLALPAHAAALYRREVGP